MSSTVTVIIPAHNSAGSLHISVESALSQSRKIDDIIIVENGSSDNTLEVATSLAGKHPNVRVLQSEKGVSAARNRGITAATTDYIGFLDADDTYASDTVETLAHFLDNYEIQFAKGNLLRLFSDHDILWRPELRTYNTVTTFEMEPNYADYVGIYCGLYRKDFLQSFDEPFPVGVHTAEDRVFVWKTLLTEAPFIHTDKVVYYYDRTSETSVLNKVDGLHFDLFEAYNILAKDYRLTESKTRQSKFWTQYVSMMEFNFFASGRLSSDGKKRWLERCRQAIQPIVGTKILKAVISSSKPRRRKFIASIT